MGGGRKVPLDLLLFDFFWPSFCVSFFLKGVLGSGATTSVSLSSSFSGNTAVLSSVRVIHSNFSGNTVALGSVSLMNSNLAKVGDLRGLLPGWYRVRIKRIGSIRL